MTCLVWQMFLTFTKHALWIGSGSSTAAERKSEKAASVALSRTPEVVRRLWKDCRPTIHYGQLKRRARHTPFFGSFEWDIRLPGGPAGTWDGTPKHPYRRNVRSHLSRGWNASEYLEAPIQNVRKINGLIRSDS